DARKLHVHQDQVGMLLPRDRHPRFPVGGLDQPVRCALQEVADQPPVHLVVLDVQDGLLAHATLPASMRSGIVKRNVDPLPSSLSTQIRPPCISTNFLAMLRPSPVPPNSRAIVASACWNSAKSPSIRSLGMPIPVSATRKRKLPSKCSTAISTRPSRVNLSALPARLVRHCVMRLLSPYASGRSSGTWVTNARPFSAAREARDVRTASTVSKTE